MKLMYKIFLKQRSSIIKKYFNSTEYATQDYDKKVYNAWYVDLKTNVGIMLGIVSVILSILSIFISFL